MLADRTPDHQHEVITVVVAAVVVTVARTDTAVEEEIDTEMIEETITVVVAGGIAIDDHRPHTTADAVRLHPTLGVDHLRRIAEDDRRPLIHVVVGTNTPVTTTSTQTSSSHKYLQTSIENTMKSQQENTKCIV